MNLQKHLERGWKSFLTFIGPSLLVTLVLLVVMVVSFGILAPVASAGYFQSLLRAQREGRVPEVRDLFSHMSLFLPLFAFGVLVCIAVVIGFLFLILPGFGVMLLLTFACLYMLPLMTDRKRGLVDAVKESWQMATADPIGDHVVITVVYVAIISLGSSIPFAILVAQPLAAFILLSFYEERVEMIEFEGGEGDVV